MASMWEFGLLQYDWGNSPVVIASPAERMITDVVELKFLLQLLAFPDYRAPMSKIKPNPKTSASERDGICRRAIGYNKYEKL